MWSCWRDDKKQAPLLSSMTMVSKNELQCWRIATFSVSKLFSSFLSSMTKELKSCFVPNLKKFHIWLMRSCWNDDVKQAPLLSSMTKEPNFLFGEDSNLVNLITLATGPKNKQTAMLENCYYLESKLLSSFLSSMTTEPKDCFSFIWRRSTLD
jgi:hypothetical protein